MCGEVYPSGSTSDGGKIISDIFGMCPEYESIKVTPKQVRHVLNEDARRLITQKRRKNKGCIRTNIKGIRRR